MLQFFIMYHDHNLLGQIIFSYTLSSNDHNWAKILDCRSFKIDYGNQIVINSVSILCVMNNIEKQYFSTESTLEYIFIGHPYFNPGILQVVVTSVTEVTSRRRLFTTSVQVRMFYNFFSALLASIPLKFKENYPNLPLPTTIKLSSSRLLSILSIVTTYRIGATKSP